MKLSEIVNDEMFLDLERRPIDQVLSDWENATASVEIDKELIDEDVDPDSEE